MITYLPLTYFKYEQRVKGWKQIVAYYSTLCDGADRFPIRDDSFTAHMKILLFLI